MFIWPTTIVHKIDRQSPLYALSAKDMLQERFELVVMLGKCLLGSIPTTSANQLFFPSPFRGCCRVNWYDNTSP